MEDDIFAQLASLVSDKPTYSNVKTGFGATSFGDASGSSSHISSDEGEMFEHDEVIVPNIRPKKTKRAKKLIVIIDDDFSTLDLMKIYLQRDYECMPFDNPKNAIFYLNSNVPDLIFIDCYLDVMSTKKVVDIIRTYKELLNVPIIYLAEPSEESAISSKLPDGVLDIISRPVKRADLQRILDEYIKPDDDSSEDDNVPKDHPII